MSNIDKRAFAKTKELATLMVERFSMNPVSSKLLNEAWEKEFPDEVAIAKRMLALLDELEAAEKLATQQGNIAVELFDEVTNLRRNSDDKAPELRSQLEEAEKRIAELEGLAFSPAILDVISERQRQRSVEGWTSEHDDAYQNSELADAAACYAINAHNQGFSTPAHWPWSPDWWKQSGPRRDLVKAGALILAEIERIDRAAGKGE